ncbi:MAG: sulfurtransferase [Granulosicoccus sp.]
MKNYIKLLIASTGLMSSIALASSFGPLVSPPELVSGMADVDPIILDIRGDDYAKGHISGAVHAPYGLFRGPKENPGKLLPVETLEERFEALGLDLSRAIVIAAEGKTDTDFGAAARVYWTLKSSGYTDIAILNGGVLGWQAAGNALDTGTVTPVPVELDITFSYAWTAETDDVLAATRDEIDALLLDARPDDFYQGKKSHAAAARPGTMPGAENFVYTSFFENKSPAMSVITDSNALRKQLGIKDGQEVVSFCNTGHWAATNWFALSEVAGIENVRLYPGSMVEYSNAGYEMQNTPGFFRHFLNKITGN